MSGFDKFADIFGFVLAGALKIEAAMPDTPGTHKLSLLLGMGALAFQQTQSIRTAWGNPDAVAKAITETAAITVAALNAAGVFKTKSTAAKPVATLNQAPAGLGGLTPALSGA